MTDTPKHSVSVAGIVVDNDGRVLVIQRRDNAHWEPPGGVLELNESPEEGTQREVFEETGVQVAVEQLSGIYKNMDRGIVAMVFRCRAVSGEPRISDESVSVAWRSREDVVSRMTPAFAIRVDDAFRNGVQVRIHDGVDLIQSSVSETSF